MCPQGGGTARAGKFFFSFFMFLMFFVCFFIFLFFCRISKSIVYLALCAIG